MCASQRQTPTATGGGTPGSSAAATGGGAPGNGATRAAASRSALGDEARGDVLCHGLWKRGETCILDVRITDTDCASARGTSSEKVLERHAKEKKNKYLDACRQRRRSFVPLVYSVDGLACKEARAFEKRVACLLAKKWDRRYSEMVGFVRARMSLAVVWCNILLLRGSRNRKLWRPEFEDGAALEGVSYDRKSQTL